MEKELIFSFIIVNYKNQEPLLDCIASIREKVFFPFEIIIANNELSELNKSFFPNAKIVEINKNIGFGSAANRGAKIACGKYLCFLNPDTVLLSDIKKITSEFEENKKVGVIGVKLVNEKGVTQNWIAGKKITFISLVLENIGWPQSKNIFSDSKKIAVDWVTGGAFFVRRKIFEKSIGFDEKFFIYYEDVDLCRRIQNSGWQIVYLPEIGIFHQGSHSFVSSPNQKKYYYASQKYYFQKYYGSFQAELVDFLRRLTHN
jgi:hypothetical protein